MKKILVPTDFSEQAENALHVASVIARQSGAEIYLLHVLDVSLGGGYGFNTMGEPNITTIDHVYVLQLMDVTRKRLADIMKKYAAAGFHMVAEVLVGNVFSTIRQQIDERKIDLVIMGTKGSSGLEEFFVGSNTEKIVRFSPCPVLSVRNLPAQFKIKDIVFASNFENDQLPAISHLKKFQDLFQANLHLLYINVPNNFLSSRVIRTRMKEFVQRYQLTHYIFTIYDDNSEEDGIIHFAEEVNADVIAVATHGRTGLSHLLSGSIAEDIVNHSNRPVLTFNLKAL